MTNDREIVDPPEWHDPLTAADIERAAQLAKLLHLGVEVVTFTLSANWPMVEVRGADGTSVTSEHGTLEEILASDELSWWMKPFHILDDDQLDALARLIRDIYANEYGRLTFKMPRVATLEVVINPPIAGVCTYAYHRASIGEVLSAVAEVDADEGG